MPGLRATRFADRPCGLGGADAVGDKGLARRGSLAKVCVTDTGGADQAEKDHAAEAGA